MNLLHGESSMEYLAYTNRAMTELFSNAGAFLTNVFLNALVEEMSSRISCGMQLEVSMLIVHDKSTPIFLSV